MNEDKLIVCTLDRTPICNLLDNTPYRARNIDENRETNIITDLSFDLPIANPKWVNIKNENLILFKDEYYVIKTPTFNHDSDGKLYVNVKCKHYSNNLAEDLISIEETDPIDVIQLMKLALCYVDGQPTKGWSVGKVTVDRVALRGLEAMEQSPFSILLTIAEKYNGMLHFNSQTMTVDLLELEDTTKPTIDIRGSKNLKSVSISYDTSEMYTRLYCYGAPDEDDNELDIMSVNPTGKPYIDNFDYYYKLGYTKEFVANHPELFAKTTIWRDSNYYDPQDLYDDGVKELVKVAQPIVEVSIEALDVSTLGKDGNPCDLQVGDCVRIVDEDLGLDTLCNVIKREINYEEPHILNITVTNSITYHDTLSKLFTNVSTVSSLVTSGGNIIGTTNMSEVEDYLNMYYLNVEQIEAKYATINLLTTNYLTADQIKASYIDATTIGATYATIASLNVVEAKIKDLDVTELNAKLANIETLIANLGEFDKLIATDAEIEDLKAGKITVIGKLTATNAEVENLKTTKLEVGDFNAYKATIENLIATKASIEELEANYIKASKIESTYAKIVDLNAVKASVETLDADFANIETLVAKKADITDLNAINATVTQLNADLVAANKLIATKVDADYVDAEIVKATKTITDDLSAIHAVVDVLDTKYATISQLNAAKADLETLISKKATIEELNVANGNISNLQALVANINTILAGAVGTGSLQTIHLTAKNVVIDDAIIKSAMIEGLDVSKLNAGTISTDKFVIQSDDGGILISGSTMQFKDGNNKVRLQVGQDAQGNFNFIVFGADGTTAIYNENGITKNAVPNGLIVDQMVSDDAAIQAKKVQYTDKDGNKTLQTVIETEQGRIDTLIKETTIDNGDGTTTSLKDAYNQTKQTVEGNTTQIGNIKTIVDETTDKVIEMDSSITEIKQTADGVSTIVSSNKGKWDKASTDATNAVNTANSAKDTANSANSNASEALNKATDLEQRADNGEFDGRGVASTVVEYKSSTNGTTAPTGTWSTTIPSVDAGSYLWTRTTITYTDSTKTISYSVAKMGTNGAKGDKGDNGTSVTIKNTEVTYQKSSSGTTTPTGTWQTSVPSTNAGEYLWTRTIVTYSDNTSTTSYSVSRNGTNGTDGKNGTNGTSPTVSSTKIEYQQSSSGTTVPSGTWSTTPPAAIAGNYMWTRTTVTYSDSKTSISYSVSKNGTNGSNGKDGANGSDGKGISSIANYYLASSLSSGVTTSTSGWTTTPQTLTSTNRYHWHYQVYSYTTGNPTTTTPAIIGVYGDTGSQGSTGATGKGITSVTPQYYLSTSNTTQSGGSWKTTQDAWSSGKYYWTRDAITWSDNTTTYTTPMLATGLNNANSVANSAQTVANQTAEKFTWLVKSGTSSTNFELTDRTATLVANKINLSGLVTFSGLDTSTQNKINNAYDTSNTNNTTIQNWISDAIDDDESKINGGYIQTNTISLKHLIVEDIFAEGAAVMNIINAQEINADRITSGLIRGNLLELYGLKVLQKTTNLETLSITDNGDITLRGSVESYNYHSGKTGWSINSTTNSAEFNDVVVRGSVITNDGGIASSGGSGRNLQQDSSFANGTISNKWVTKTYHSVDTTLLCDGVNSIKYSRHDATSNSVVYFYTSATNNPIVPVEGQEYTVSAKFYTKDVSAIVGTKPILGLWYYNSAGSAIKSERIEIPFVDNEWVYVTLTSTCPTDAVKAAFVVGAYNNGEFWMSQPKLEEGGVATPYSLAPEDKIKQVRFWAGASYDEREYAPAIIYNDGSVKFTKGEFSGLWTGNIEIGNITIIDPSKTSGNDAILTIQNGQNGVKKIQLTDTSSSIFAQNIIVSDNYYNTKISLNQDGSGSFSGGINIGNNTIFKDKILTMGGYVLKVGSNGYVFDTPQLDIGGVDSHSMLNVYGESYFNESIHVTKTINFNDVIECTVSPNGLDFNFIN